MNKTTLILLGLIALSGGAYYLYKTGVLVATPTFGQGVPSVKNRYLTPMVS